LHLVKDQLSIAWKQVVALRMPVLNVARPPLVQELIALSSIVTMQLANCVQEHFHD
jgi:hypothetical protein